MLVVVPTSQGGRRLREALAEEAGVLLSPKVVTPGSLLTVAGQVAPGWLEQLAWAEVLEEIRDWEDYVMLFPEKPGEGEGWAAGLAAEMTRLRAALQENGLTLKTGGWMLRETVEGERWAALAKLEQRVEARLSAWGLASRSRALAEGVALPPVGHIVLAGVAEMPPLVARALMEHPGGVTALIGAPASMAEDFTALGLPGRAWVARDLPWPDGRAGSVTVAADPRQQAAVAFQAVAQGGRPSSAVVLGSADAEAGAELQRAFTRGGWPAFLPSAASPAGGLARWFGLWREWLADPKMPVLADLLALPETGILVEGRRAQKAEILAWARDEWMAVRVEDLRRRIATVPFRKDWQKAAAEELLEAARRLEVIRQSLLGRDFPRALRRLLEMLGRTTPEAADEASLMSEWLDEAAPFITGVDRGAGYWIDLMVASLPEAPPVPPPGRVVDIQGWLELLHEPGPHLVLCGLNEGKVPARGGGEPWLSEAVRKCLRLITDEDRAARDAFLLHAMIESRRAAGRVDLICAKVGAGGESLLPSRLLLAAPRERLPDRIDVLFREVEPPEAGLRWEADWKWRPRDLPPPRNVAVTALRDYLKCPFRFYLKHVVRMRRPDTERGEWSARDFGNVVHEILEKWGRDEEARDFSKGEAIEAYFHAELDQVISRWFGARVPLAIGIQREAMRQRLSWLARRQACERAAGWRVEDVERPVELVFGALAITAKIDRIDRHRDGGMRVIDYKTGKVSAVDKEHRIKVGSSTVIPEHLVTDSPALHDGLDEKDRSVRYLWTNLQLPLYAAAVEDAGQGAVIPCYFTLGATEGDVAMHEWAAFSAEDLASARNCAAWLAGKISGGIFWPPAERVTYDDYGILSAGRSLQEMVAAPDEAAGWIRPPVLETSPGAGQ